MRASLIETTVISDYMDYMQHRSIIALTFQMCPPSLQWITHPPLLLRLECPCSKSPVYKGPNLQYTFLAVQDSSIGDVVTQWVSEWVSQVLISATWELNRYNHYNLCNHYRDRDSNLDLDLDWGAYQIIVADAADAVSVNFSGRCKFLQI